MLLPGLVNVHTHLELTAFRGYLEHLGFRHWLQKLMRARDAVMTEERRLASARVGIAEGLLHGITTYGDVSDSGLSAISLDEMHARGVVYAEVFGPDPRQSTDALSAVKATIQKFSASASERIRIGLSPHAPYSVSDALFQGAAELSRTMDWPLTVHIAESELERALVCEGQGEMADALRARGIAVERRARSPIVLLDACGLLTPRTLLIHAVRIDNADLALIAAGGCAVAHCPASNAKLGHGIAPVSRMTAAGVTVGLGTDSVASNNRMDILDEARLAVLMSGAGNGAESPIDAHTALSMATAGGAAALGLEREIGTLEVGKAADLCAFRLNDLSDLPVHDVEAALVFGAGGRHAVLTVVAGKELVRDGVLIADTAKDLELVIQSAEEMAKLASLAE